MHSSPRHYVEVSGQYHGPDALLPGRDCWVGVWVDPRAGLDAVEKSKYTIPTPAGNRTQVVKPVA